MTIEDWIQVKYYQVWQDMSVRGRWVLGDIRHLNNWDLIEPPAWLMEPGRFALDVTQQGREMDYSIAGYACVPVVSAKFRNALAGLWEVDEPYMHVVLEEVFLHGQECVGDYFLMIVETCIDCVDEGKSDFSKFELNNPVRPDLSGQYSGFRRLVIDPVRVGGSHIFRIERFSTSLIVSEEVRARLERAGVAGIEFVDVSG